MELLKIISDNRIKLQGIVMELSVIKEWPVTIKSVERYEKAYKLAKDEIADRQFSDEVSGFLKKVQLRKATLKDLTSNVQEWIVSEGLEDKICLSIATK